MCVTVRMTVFLEDEADNTEFLYSRTIIFIQLLMPFCSLEFFLCTGSIKKLFNRHQLLFCRPLYKLLDLAQGIGQV